MNISSSCANLSLLSIGCGSHSEFRANLSLFFTISSPPSNIGLLLGKINGLVHSFHMRFNVVHKLNKINNLVHLLISLMKC